MFRSLKKLNVLSIVICILSIVFFTSSAYARSVNGNNRSANGNNGKFNVKAISISEEYGAIKEIFEGKTGKSVVFIQDLHGNFEVQKNCARIIKTIRKKFHSDKILINIEGASGFIDTSTQASIPRKDIKEFVGEYFMSRGQINGAEYFSIVEDVPVLIYGAENHDLYVENFDAFRSAFKEKTKFKRLLNNVKDGLSVVKYTVFSKPLAQLVQKYDDYNESLIVLPEYVKYLQKTAKELKIDLKAYPNCGLLLKSLELEDMVDGNKLEVEREILIKALQKKINRRSYTKLIRMSLQLRAGEISHYRYYNFLNKSARKCSLKIERLPEMSIYLKLLNYNAQIKQNELMNELDSILTAMKEKLYVNDREREYDLLLKDFDVLGRLVTLSLSRKEADYFMANKDIFEKDKFIANLKKEADEAVNNPEITGYERICVLKMAGGIQEVEKILKTLPMFERFYRLALERDDVIVDNVITRMDMAGFDYSILVAGGFHLEGIIEGFRDRGISYVVIVPSMTDFQANNPYITMMMGGEKTPFEMILLSEARGLAIPSLLGENPVFGEIAKKAFMNRTAILVHILAIVRGVDLKLFADQWFEQKKLLLERFASLNAVTKKYVTDQMREFGRTISGVDVSAGDIEIFEGVFSVPFRFSTTKEEFVLFFGDNIDVPDTIVIDSGAIGSGQYVIIKRSDYKTVKGTFPVSLSVARVSDIIDNILGISLIETSN